jgi:hypothetical protein
MALARGRARRPSTTQSSNRSRTLEPAAIIELVVWLSVLQMLHRLGAYYRA